jgi:hypothetical protein
MQILRQNSQLRTQLGSPGVDFIEHATGAIQRLLPHVQTSNWSESTWKASGCFWASNKRTEVRIVVAIGEQGSIKARSLTTIVTRRQVSTIKSATIDNREKNICELIAKRISDVLLRAPNSKSDDISINAIRDAFDEYVVANHIQEHHGLTMPVTSVLRALHTLSEQSYENKALTFGCILDPASKSGSAATVFPTGFLESKKYKALSDGFRTAYLVSTNGHVSDFVDLEHYGSHPLTEKHYFPDWTEAMAKASRNGRCGISLSRQGDICVFDEGTLRFTYRYGKWQYWNHNHLINLLRDRAKVQRVKPSILGRVVGAIYRAALDVSFRRSGGLFVVLRRRNNLHDIVRLGDAVSDPGRTSADASFDNVMGTKTIQGLMRSVLVELASLDGAVVIENSGQLVAYGSVLQPKKKGKLHGTEGSRTKAAIGASYYGLAVKVSSDGDISVYHEGKEFLRV